MTTIGSTYERNRKLSNKNTPQKPDHKALEHGLLGLARLGILPLDIQRDTRMALQKARHEPRHRIADNGIRIRGAGVDRALHRHRAHPVSWLIRL